MRPTIDEEVEVDVEDARMRVEGESEAAVAPSGALPWIPLVRVSGRYELVTLVVRPFVEADPAADGAELGADGALPVLPWLRRGVLHLDVDDRDPQHAASGTLQVGLAFRVHWIARLRSAGSLRWSGDIWFKDGNTSAFPYTRVEIRVSSPFLSPRTATVRFSVPGGSVVEYRFRYASRSFRAVNFEFDSAPDANPVLSIDRHAHPNRPSTLPAGNLSVQDAFTRAGFEVSTSAATPVVPKPLAGADGRWSDMELHDAMQTYWSRFDDRAQWAMWVFYGALHEMGTGLGGIMFDDIGPNHRQGTAIFTESFIKDPPVGDPAPAAWARRMAFWTACHEMGHAFNLAHSWQKSLGTPWIPLANEPSALSFMNYPYNFPGGQTAFFKNFHFRFSDAELLFLRHAPERFVQMGNAAWFDHHGFEQAEVSPEPAFRLELRLNKSTPRLQYLEPAVVDLQLTNVSDQPRLVSAKILSDLAALTVVVKREGQPAREFQPYATYCSEGSVRVLQPKEALSESLFLGADRGAGRDGWLLSEPGRYTIQAMLQLGEEEIVSAPLEVRVEAPLGLEELRLAQDYFSDGVGRVLFFDGSNALTGANDTLREMIAKLPANPVAIHASLALGRAASAERKVLQLAEGQRALCSASQAKAKVTKVKAQPEEAVRHFKRALETKPDLAAQSLGQSDFQFYVDRYAEILGEGERKQATVLREKASQHGRDGEARRTPRR